MCRDPISNKVSYREPVGVSTSSYLFRGYSSTRNRGTGGSPEFLPGSSHDPDSGFHILGLQMTRAPSPHLDRNGRPDQDQTWHYAAPCCPGMAGAVWLLKDVSSRDASRPHYFSATEESSVLRLTEVAH